ncbi:hypothetical protein PNEG_04346 [Pneumocystis murina B123]|uniref:Uncharacterized protein n=1 Tax=Pneumocystis murina (strain B123) TaxID=1069680 RepID=A0A0W4ZWU1_PNEMU|nr:hypothetical protein PNEG_04346 [Pneumocystis murina B123]KTW32845.1 hypothetical protein PNEG_04346 [Pneumocystis murina B123]
MFKINLFKTKLGNSQIEQSIYIILIFSISNINIFKNDIILRKSRFYLYTFFYLYFFCIFITIIPDDFASFIATIDITIDLILKTFLLYLYKTTSY